MSFEFKNKCIYILSPGNWSKMKLSKHYYAIELAKRGNEVYFIGPPNITLKEKVIVETDKEIKTLHIVSYKPEYRGKKILPEFIYNQLFKLQIWTFRKYLKKPDVVLCFDVHRFPNLKWFKAKRSIMFVADLFKPGVLPSVISSADICFGVTDTIIEQVKHYGTDATFINHGLNDTFKEIALKKLAELPTTDTKPTGKIKVGYMGNLFMEAMDRPVMKRVIEENPTIDFVFWGQYLFGQDKMDIYKQDEVFEFIEFLQKQPNVFLRGVKTSTELMEELLEMDMFWICYAFHKSWLWDGSNSHKLLEYLAMGKPVVAHYVSSYKDNQFLHMLPEKDNTKYHELFAEVLALIQKGEDKAAIKERLEFAILNSYQNQVSLIEAYINKKLAN